MNDELEAKLKEAAKNYAEVWLEAMNSKNYNSVRYENAQTSLCRAAVAFHVGPDWESKVGTPK
jgi:hypothetical protein